MTYEYRIISASAEDRRRPNERRPAMPPTGDDLEAALNELAAEGYRYVGAATWGVRRGDQVLIMEREGQPETT